MSYAYDGAYARNLDTMAANGAIAVSVYLTGNFAVPKTWVDQIHAKGLGVIPNYEQAADELVNAGFAGGVAIGQRAMAAAKALGIPADGSVAIVYSIDVNVPVGSFPFVGAAFDGINSVTSGQYLTGAYGEGALIDWLATHGKTSVKGWLSGSSSFPGFDPADSHVALVQLIGSPVPGTDQDRFTDPAGIHAWWPPNSPYGGDMALSADDKAWLTALIDDRVNTIVNGSDPQHMNNLANIRGHVVGTAAAVWATTIPDGNSQTNYTAAQRLTNPSVGTVTLDPAQIAQLATALAITPEQIKAALAGHTFSGTTTLTAE